MPISKWFTKLMKNEPTPKNKQPWLIDESKCLNSHEVIKIRQTAERLKLKGLKTQRFTLIRNWFMIELSIHAGLRVNEMAHLQNGDLLIEGSRSSIVVIGKGQKRRSVWISSYFREICHTYFQLKQQFGFSLKPNAYILPNLKDERISKRSLQKMFKAIARQANLAPHYSIHCMRHTYATFLLKASNYNYRFVQQQLGHASIKTTQIYATVLETDGRNALEKMYRKEDMP